MIRNTDIQKAIEQLNKKGFQKTIDKISDYSTNADLYYLELDKNRFIIFNHFNKRRKKDLQGFDCWISTYNSKKEIGNKKAQNMSSVRLSFDFSEDWKLLTDKLNDSD